MYRNFSKILSGLHNDIVDWVAQTRVKSAQLLYNLLVNEEDNVTQHLEKVLNCLQRATSDDEAEVITYVNKSAELVGYFVDPEVWVKMVLKHVKLTQTSGSLMLLASVLQGCEGSQLTPYLIEITSVLVDPEICRSSDVGFDAFD